MTKGLHESRAWRVFQLYRPNLLSLAAPHATPIYDLATHLVYSASKADVTDVFVAGRQVVENRRIVALDMAGPLAEMRALGAKIVAGAPL